MRSLPPHRLLTGIALLLVIAALLPQSSAQAGTIDSLVLPDDIARLPSFQEDADILGPDPWTGSWSEPGHKPLAVNFNSYDLTKAQIDAARATGCGMVRIELPMERFITQAEPDWAVLDVVVSRLKRAGLEVVPVLTAKSVVPQFFREFCGSVASRYGQSFHYYQILDNINLQPGLYTRDYVELLIKARLAIVLADPDALIVTGGIRGADLTYLEQLEAQNALRNCDILAFNIYPPMEGIEGHVQSQRIDHCVPFFGEVCDWARARGKKVWVTSFGMSTSLGGNGVDQVDQASAYARGALLLGYLGVEQVFFAAIQDTDPTYTRPALCCGLLDVSGRPKASYQALRVLNTVVSNSYHVSPEFPCDSIIYQVPDASEVMALSNDELPEYDPIADYQVHGLDVYGYWFYEPDLEEYRLVYWLARDLLYDVVVSVGIRHGGLEPQESFLLLDNDRLRLEPDNVKDLTLVNYVPVSTLPGVITYKVAQDG